MPSRSPAPPRQAPQQQRPTTETAIAQYKAREAHPIVRYIDEQMPSIALMLPRSTNPDRFKATLLHALIVNPDILQCTPQSIIRAVMQAASEGLEPTGAMGGAYLVPFAPERGAQPEATLLRDYRGLSRMAIRSGAAKRILAHAVRAGDGFEYELGTDPKLVHRPKIGNDAAAHTFYAIADLPDGSQQVEVMTRKQVDHIRAKSRMKDSGPWRNDYDQMARKTVIRRLMNYLPLSPDQREAIDREERVEFGDDAMAPIARVSATTQHGDLAERAAQRAALLAGGTEQPGPALEGKAPAPAPTPPAAAAAEATTPEPTLAEATESVMQAGLDRGMFKGLSDAEAWTEIDKIAHEAIPDVKLADLAVADWLAVRERIVAGEFDQAVATPRAEAATS